MFSLAQTQPPLITSHLGHQTEPTRGVSLIYFPCEFLEVKTDQTAFSEFRKFEKLPHTEPFQVSNKGTAPALSLGLLSTVTSARG